MTKARDELLRTLSELVGFIHGLQIRPSMQTWVDIDITMAQLKGLLVVLWTGGLTGSTLADKLGVGPPAVTALIDGLVAHKLVRREPDIGDRRVIWIRATARGEALRARLLYTNDSVLRSLTDEVDADDVPAITRALQVLAGKARQRVQKGKKAGPASDGKG